MITLERLHAANQRATDNLVREFHAPPTDADYTQLLWQGLGFAWYLFTESGYAVEIGPINKPNTH